MVQTKSKIFNKLLFTIGLVFTLSACQALPTRQPQLPVYDEYISGGDILPIQTITTIDGEVLNLHHLGKRKLVILFASWCTDSNRLLSALNNSALINDKKIEIIAIAREEDQQTIKSWREKSNIKVALAVDTDRSIYKRFASGGIPRLITVAENNKIIKMNLAEGEQQLEKIVWR